MSTEPEDDIAKQFDAALHDALVEQMQEQYNRFRNKIEDAVHLSWLEGMKQDAADKGIPLLTGLKIVEVKL